MDRIGGGGGPHVGFEAVAIDPIDRANKQAGDIVLQPETLLHSDPGSGNDLDHDLGIAVGVGVAMRAGSLHSSAMSQ